MDQEHIGKFIAECRKQKKMTQVELAEKLGVTEKSVNNWENGRNMPDLSLFKPICFIIGLGVYILYETMEIDVKYDARVMECNIQNNELVFQNKGISVFNMYYTTKTINDNHYIIFHNTVYLQNKRRSNWEYGESFATYLTEGRIPFASILTYDDLEDYDNVFVYYTDDSIKKIEKLSNSEFMNELDNLHLMCQLN